MRVRSRRCRPGSMKSPPQAASRCTGTPKISALLLPSTAPWRCIRNATRCCSTAIPRSRATGSTGSRPVSRPIRPSGRRRPFPTTVPFAAIRMRWRPMNCPPARIWPSWMRCSPGSTPASVAICRPGWGFAFTYAVPAGRRWGNLTQAASGGVTGKNAIFPCARRKPAGAMYFARMCLCTTRARSVSVPSARA